MTQVLPDR